MVKPPSVNDVTRRTFLKLSGGVAGLAAGVHLTGPVFAQALALPSSPFQYGVASGDPLPDAVIIWTRVTPDPTASPGSGNGAPTVVTWQVAGDPGFASVVASGSVATDPASDHTVKVDVTGLSPATAYWYRFSALGATSPVGATRTAPASTASAPRLRFGFVSCSNYDAGWFTPYRYLASRCDLDFVLHVGDYTYEYGSGQYGSVRNADPTVETVTLEQYRRRQAIYKADGDLQALHGAVPWITTIDDHEVADNSWRLGAANHQPATEGDYITRRNAAYQAYVEWMPIRLPQPATADETRFYRRLRWGTLADLILMDLRQYRDQQTVPTDPALTSLTMTGSVQQGWLASLLSEANPSPWRLFGNSVQFMQVLYPYTGPSGFPQLTAQTALNTDAWDGYPGTRGVLQQLFAQNAGTYDAVMLTGDIHSSWAAELPVFGAPPVASGYTPVATEFVCTSVTSDGFGDILPAAQLQQGVQFISFYNPHVRFIEPSSHGASVVDVTPERLQVDWFYTRSSSFTDPRQDPSASLVPGASWETLRGSKRVTPVRADKAPAPVIDTSCAGPVPVVPEVGLPIALPAVAAVAAAGLLAFRQRGSRTGDVTA